LIEPSQESAYSEKSEFHFRLFMNFFEIILKIDKNLLNSRQLNRIKFKRKMLCWQAQASTHLDLKNLIYPPNTFSEKIQSCLEKMSNIDLIPSG
jgi:hypothetical protein